MPSGSCRAAARTARTSDSGRIDELGRPGHQRQQQDSGPELIGQVPELAELTLAERPPGREREHRGAAELGPHVGRPSAERAERAVLGRAERGDRPGQPERVALGVGGAVR